MTEETRRSINAVLKESGMVNGKTATSPEVEFETEAVDLISFDPENIYVFGVFGNEVHIDATLLKDAYNPNYTEVPIVGIMSVKTYKKVISDFIKEKRDYCERLNYYCGLVYLQEVEFKKLNGTIIINDYENNSKIEREVFLIKRVELSSEHG